MSNKFLVFPCTDQSNESGYSGPVVTMACVSNLSFVLFFPTSSENSKIINYVLDHKPQEFNSDNGIIGIYKTMLNSWEAGGRYLSGICLDIEFDTETGEDAIVTSLIISGEDGSIDSILFVNFTHAILLAAIERKDIIVSNRLIEKLIPNEEMESEGDEETIEGKQEAKISTPQLPQNNKFPVDKDILDIAKKIMSGKIK